MTSNKFDKSDFIDRFKQLLTFLNEKPTPFSKKIGISKAFMNDVLHLRSGPSVQMFYGISKSSSDVNTAWLLTGKGEMLVSGEDQAEQQRLQAEYWQGKYNLLEVSVKVARQRVIGVIGKDQADEVFREII